MFYPLLIIEYSSLAIPLRKQRQQKNGQCRQCRNVLIPTVVRQIKLIKKVVRCTRNEWTKKISVKNYVRTLDIGGRRQEISCSGGLSSMTNRILSWMKLKKKNKDAWKQQSTIRSTNENENWSIKWIIIILYVMDPFCYGNSDTVMHIQMAMDMIGDQFALKATKDKINK